MLAFFLAALLAGGARGRTAADAVRGDRPLSGGAVPPATSVDTAKGAALLQWVAEGGGSHLPVEIAETAHGRGLVLTRDTPPDTLLLFVPRDKALSLQSSAMPGPQKDALKAAGTALPIGAANQYVLIALALLYEQSLGTSSRFGPYVGSLPTTPPSNMFSWNQDQLKAALSVLEDKMTTAATLCPGEVTQLLNHLAESHTGGGWFSSSAAESAAWAKDVTDERKRWACSIAFSRNFNGTLMPVADMAK
jgi:hypothetical protein